MSWAEFHTQLKLFRYLSFHPNHPHILIKIYLNNKKQMSHIKTSTIKPSVCGKKLLALAVLCVQVNKAVTHSETDSTGNFSFIRKWALSLPGDDIISLIYLHILHHISWFSLFRKGGCVLLFLSTADILTCWERNLPLTPSVGFSHTVTPYGQL